MVKLLKKFAFVLVLILCLVPCVTILHGCTEINDNKIHIVTTIFPQYDFVRNIVGDRADKFDIKYIVDNGSDVHSYSSVLSVEDIVKMSTSDLFIYVGGESESWVNTAISSPTNKNMKVLKLMDTVHDDLISVDHDHEHDNEAEEFDEHIWLSLRLAKKMVTEIAESICRLDLDNSEYYRNNALTYCTKLDALDSQFSNIIKNKNAVVFADRNPFTYLLNDYDIPFYSAFEGCSTDTNASFETLINLAKIIDENDIKYVINIDGSRDDVPNQIISITKNKNQKILTMNSMQAVTSKVSATLSYIDAMQQNLNVLKTAMY